MIDYNFINNFLIYLIDISGFLLAIWVFLNSKKKKANKVFSFFIISILSWITFYHFAFISGDQEISLILFRISGGSVFLFFIFYYYFVILFTRENKFYEQLGKLIIIYGLLFSFFTIFTDLIIKNSIVESWGVSPGFSLFGRMTFYGYVIILTLLINKILITKYFTSTKIEKLKIQYFLTGFIIFAVLNFIFNVLLPVFFKNYHFFWTWNYLTIVLIAFTAHAITKHELMGIKTLLTQVLIIIISIILLLDIFLLSDGLTIQLLKAGILLAFLYFSRELVKSVRKEKEAREELENTYEKINQYVRQLEKINKNLEERNNDLKAIFEATGKTIEALDSQKIAQNIVDSIPRNLGHLGNKCGILVLYDKNKRIIYTYAITESKIVKKAEKLLDKPFKDYIEFVDNTDNLIIKTIKTKKIYVGNKLEDFIAPTVNKNICGLIQKLVGAKSFVSIPLLSRGSMVGVIVFVGTKPIEKVTQRDKDVLYMFSSHIGSAIENAQLYEQTNKQMSELAKLNRNLAEANQKLKELMAIKNEFLHITSHQLRTPLTVLRGMISMWYEGDFDKLPPGEKRRMLKRICVSAERLNNITNDMLDALELEGGFSKFQFKPVSLEEIIKETINILKSGYDQKKLYINFNAENEDSPEVEVEPNYIRQVFLNIIDNACKYTKEGGVDIDLKTVRNYIQVSIKDTGVGASKNDQKRIFQKFTRGRNAVAENASGSGLGLFIAKEIVDRHHGKIEFFSEGIGKGSIVKINLPIKQEE